MIAELALDVAKDRGGFAAGRVTLRQGEVGSATLNVSVRENGSAYDLTGKGLRFMATLSGGSVIVEDATVTDAPAGRATYTLPPEAASAAGGVTLAYFAAYQGTALLCATEAFDIDVLPGTDLSADPPSDYVPLLDRLAAEAQDAIDGCAAATEAATTAAASATEAATSATGAAASATAAATTASSSATACDEAVSGMDARIGSVGQLLFASALHGEEGGTVVQLPNQLNACPLPSLAIDGKAVQDGTPTPDSPIDIEVVGSPVSVRRAGRNLCRVDDGTYLLVSGCTAVVSGGTITVNGTAQNNGVNISDAYTLKAGSYYMGVIQEGVGAKLYLYDIDAGSNLASCTTGCTLTIAEDKHVKTRLVMNPGTYADKAFSYQLELGSTETTYEPYEAEAHSYALPTEHPYLASLPYGTKDVLTAYASGVLRVDGRVGRIEIDGTVVRVIVVDEKTYTYCANVRIKETKNQITCSTHFLYGWNYNDGNCFASGTLIKMSRSKSSGLSSYELWNEWLASQATAGTPITVYYTLATPVAYWSADNGTTWTTTEPDHGDDDAIVWTSGTDTSTIWCEDALSPTVTADYIQDTSKVIAELQAAVSSITE